MALRRLCTLLALCALILSTGCCGHRCWLHRRRCCEQCCSSPCNSCCGYAPAHDGHIAPIPAPVSPAPLLHSPAPVPPPVPAPLCQHP